MVDPATIMAGTAVAGLGLNAAGLALGGGGTEGLSREDQRWLADFQWKQALRNEDFQHKLAESGIRMRVADAEAAGLHPLAALGVQGIQGSFGSSINGSPASRDGHLGRGLSEMGQDISRAAMSMATQEEKAFKALQLENMKIQNEILKTDLTERRNRLTAPGTGPGIGSQDPFLTGQGDAPFTTKAVVDRPLMRTMPHPTKPWQQHAPTSDLAFARTPHGYVPVPSKDVKEQIEDQFIPEMMWAVRNYLFPNLGFRHQAPDYPLPKGYDYWGWSPPLQQWVPRKSWFKVKIRGKEVGFGL